MGIPQQLHKLFSNVLGRENSRLLYHTCPTFTECSVDIITFFLKNDDKATRIPEIIQWKSYKFNYIFYTNNFSLNYDPLRRKMFNSGLPKKLRKLIISISQEPHVDTIEQLISELIGALFIQNEKSNYNRIQSKNTYICRVLNQNSSIKTMRKCINSSLQLFADPSLPSIIKINSQVMVCIDDVKDIVMLQFDREAIEIDILNEMFTLTPSTNLLQNSFSKSPTWSQMDTDFYTGWFFKNLESNGGMYDINFQRKDVNLETIQRWNEIQLTEYKANRRELNEKYEKKNNKKNKKNKK